ncbi:MAG TPA: ribonuclease J [Bdellovibrionales bacterium]|nr:MAG: hypothetical protein A2Z97_01740 [Bdellovibrionales bacterium GWB1_52_6]OFZ04929.1 MAG: hypothetical protein A2X97_16330 [Bdellovibrionales bacterium GWA1_52_35]OFZ35650.1 MAG: hypothetical protein A2070_13310 [Bdellovibrionales bacterium GWC1_52_8]HAR43148.1 ribonuclease J [Bdellovibrionales bacterium]HCM38865.1 ribonuclease J [Bdellovibrionales bacterium]
MGSDLLPRIGDLRVSELRIVPLGGLGEIGMNCMALEYGDEIIVVDCGLLFSDLDHLGVGFVIPDFTYLKERKDRIKAFVITHGHEDHIGALPFALKAGLHAPIYVSNFTSLLLRQKLSEYELDETVDLRRYEIGSSFQIGSFRIKTVCVNHSIVDSAALIIDTPVGKVIHTGDFKIDTNPYYGKTIDLPAFEKAGDDGVLLLLSDSTNVERHTHSLSESVIYTQFEKFFKESRGLTIVSMFASNVGRMGQVLELAGKLDKKVALSGRGIEQNVRLGMEAGYLKGAESVLIDLADMDRYARDQVVILSTGSQGEYRSSLIRIAQGEHGQITLQKGDQVLMSSKFIPGNEKAIGRMINSLFKQGAEVLYEAIHDIHVSGHATRPELKKMLELVRPKYFIPVHGEYRHLVHHSNLARETGVPADNVLIATNGDIVGLSPDSCRILEHMEETRVLVEGREGGDVSKLMLKDRRQLGEKGIVFSLVVRNSETRRIISGPELISKGLASEQIEAWLLDEGKNLVRKVIEKYEAGLDSGAPPIDLQETIRIELRRFFNNNIGKKPIVLPIVLDL